MQFSERKSKKEKLVALFKYSVQCVSKMQSHNEEILYFHPPTTFKPTLLSRENLFSTILGSIPAKIIKKTLLRGRRDPMEFSFPENKSDENDFLAFFFQVFYF